MGNAQRNTPGARGRALTAPKSMALPCGGAVRNFVQFSTSPSPTTLRSILLINSVLWASAAFMSVRVCFKVLVFEPKTTVPPITAAIAPGEGVDLLEKGLGCTLPE